MLKKGGREKSGETLLNWSELGELSGMLDICGLLPCTGTALQFNLLAPILCSSHFSTQFNHLLKTSSHSFPAPEI